jgi:RyR domain
VAGGFSPSALLEKEPVANVMITFGRSFGLATTICSAILIGIATMGQTLSAFWTRHFRRDHAIVLGETLLAERIVRIFRAKGIYTVHVVAKVRAANAPFEAEKITGFGLDDLVEQAGLAKAATIVVDTGTDASTLYVGRAIWSHLDGCAHRLQRLALRIADPLLADATTAAMLPTSDSQPPRPRLFDENHIMAQAQLLQLPLFRIAGALKQDRVHALILGFGDLGEKLLDQVMLTSVAGKLGAPMVTVADRAAVQTEARFRARRPGVAASLDIDFVSLDVGVDPMDDGDPPKGLAQLVKRGAAHPYTCVFIALPTDSDTLQAAQLMQRLRERHGLLEVPLILGSRSADAWPQQKAAVWDESKPGDGRTTMSLSDADLAEYLLEPQLREKLARLLHDTYRKGPAASGPAAVEWQHLPETYRRATLRAADHVPAKLWTLGLTVERGGLQLSPSESAKLETLLQAGEDNPLIADLARVEHERWMVERKLDGWRYGPVRDNKLLIHPLLVSWEMLQKSPSEVKKDSDQVLAALKQVVGR